MLKFPDIAVVFVALSFQAFVTAEEDRDAAAGEPDFEVLESGDGTLLEDCRVMRVETDGLVLQHREGVAHVSFFDLPREVQERYDFDPVEALRAYKERTATERERRQRALLATEKRKAAEQRAAAEKERYEMARREWMPAEATIVETKDDGSYAKARRITLVPTKTVSTLGFEREGPPKRVLKSFGAGTVFLKLSAPAANPGARWRGYIDPVSRGTVVDPASGLETVPVHHAVPRAE
ncbi:MAG: hypothetical protein WD342_11490 [Verrucomicrobiales bacterium]